MFSPNVVGTANAFAGGWGNLGGGFTQLVRDVVVCDEHSCFVHVILLGHRVLKCPAR